MKYYEFIGKVWVRIALSGAVQSVLTLCQDIKMKYLNDFQSYVGRQVNWNQKRKQKLLQAYQRNLREDEPLLENFVFVLRLRKEIVPRILEFLKDGDAFSFFQIAQKLHLYYPYLQDRVITKGLEVMVSNFLIYEESSLVFKRLLG